MSGIQTRNLVIIGVVLAAVMAVGLLKAMGPGASTASQDEQTVSPTTTPPGTSGPMGPPIATKAEAKPGAPEEAR
ncbi:MAG TPA: hypothetical protein PLQ54_18805, partial [Armatimonadota bacterium]|nr:hypothetical protein [Armatimonadota bacterium]